MKRVLVFGLFAALALGCTSVNSVTPSQPDANAPTPIITTPPARSQSGYANERFGFRFYYLDDGYVLDTSRADLPIDAISGLMGVIQVWRAEDFAAHTSANPPTEQPPTLTVSVYDNPGREALEEWKTRLSLQPTQEQELTVAGRPAIAYSSTGLYEYDNVLVTSPDGLSVIHFSVGYLGTDDAIRDGLDVVVTTFQFDGGETAEVDYSLLEQHLANQDWQAADYETQNLMAALMSQFDRFNPQAGVESIPCEDLTIIDRLWTEASEGRFGFKAQAERWQALQNPNNTPEATVEQFGTAIGWRRTQPAPESRVDLLGFRPEWYSSSEVQHRLEAPVGHLPWGGVSENQVVSLLKDAASTGCGSCTIDAMYLHEGRFQDYLPALFERVEACAAPTQPE
jgi:hypothetical protein